jgi:predicted nucleotide-binding protein
MAEDAPQLTDVQRQVLALILAFFLENRRWPTYQWLDQVAYIQSSIEFEPVYVHLPPGLVLPPADPSRGGARPDGTLSLTLTAVIALGREDLLAPFLKTARYLGERAATYIPPESGTAELIVTSTEVATAIGLPADDPGLALARELVTNSLWEMWSGSSGDAEGGWAISLRPDKARIYRDVHSIPDVLTTHEPIAIQRRLWSRAVSGEPEADETEAEHDNVQRDAVFVVYGRNELARAAIFEFLAELGLEPLSWDKLLATTGDAAPYVGQVLDAGFAIAQAVLVLLTPDDEARLRPAFVGDRDPAYETDLTPQARPNVLFEAGMAHVSHPGRTILVELGILRPFSDVAGRHVVHLNDSLEQRRALVERLRTAGCPVNADGNWRHAGNFTAALATADTQTGSPDGAPAGVQFALQAEQNGPDLGGGPITLRVENDGPTDEFEASVVAVHGCREARAPWQIRWRHSSARSQEILAGHHWILEICEDSSQDTELVWQFLLPDAALEVRPDDVGGQPGLLRATVKVAPRSRPLSAITNTLSLSLSERGRAAAWDLWRAT